MIFVQLQKLLVDIWYVDRCLSSENHHHRRCIYYRTLCPGQPQIRDGSVLILITRPLPPSSRFSFHRSETNYRGRESENKIVDKCGICLEQLFKEHDMGARSMISRYTFHEGGLLIAGRVHFVEGTLGVDAFFSGTGCGFWDEALDAGTVLCFSFFL